MLQDYSSHAQATEAGHSQLAQFWAVDICKFFRISLLAILVLPILFSWAASSQSMPPRILYSDLESGPNSGGQNNGGAFVTIYGMGFGATRGSSVVTIGGGPAVAYPVWTDTKISFQLGPSAQTGNIIVSVNGQSSVGVPFTVRPGNIYFVANAGNDANPGNFALPWQTIQNAVNTINPGDIIYVMDGVVEAQPAYDGSLQLNSSGTPGNPMAVVAYPGATVIIGGTGSSQCVTDPCYEGLRNTGTPSHWVFANLLFRGNDRAVTLEGDATLPNGILTDLRFVGNDFSCPWGGVTPDACVVFGESLYIKFYGNTVHDVATLNTANAIDEGHGLYFSSDVSHVDAGWNHIYNIMSCRGLQIHSSPLYNGAGTGDPTGYNVFDIKIHDNLIHNTRCDGIIMATLAPEKGPIQVYNNVIHSAGVGPLPQGGGGGFTCLYVSGGTNNGPDSNGTVNVYNNTMYDCGSYSRPDGAAVSAAVTLGNYSPNLKLLLQNNIIYQTSGETYTWDYNAPYAYNMTGSNNLFFGSSISSGSSYTTNLYNNPLLVDPLSGDFHLQSVSPAIKTGLSISGLAMDKDGNPRPQFGAFDLGAYQYVSSFGPPSVSVAVAPTAISLQAAQQQQFTATVTGSTNAAVIWSLNPTVGTVSATGLYTAPALINAQQNITVTATSVADITKSASAVITLNPPIQVTVAPSTVSLKVGQQQQFTATVTGSANAAVIWSVNPMVGTISATGLYTAPALINSQQNVTVTATSVADITKSASAVITLSPVIQVTAAPSTVSLKAGQQQQFTATVTGSTNAAVTWSLNPVVGTVSATGLYTAPAVINAQQNITVTATSVADITKSASAVITLNTAVQVTVAPSTVSLKAGQQQQFTAAVLGSTNAAVTWSLNPTVGTISATGLYTAPALINSQQNITVTATSVADITKSASAVVTLNPPIQVTVAPSTVSLKAGQQQQFTASVTGTSNGAVNWSLGSGVGTISTTGLYTAPASVTTQQTVTVIATSSADPSKSGRATITLTTNTGPVISAVAASLIITSRANITWATNVAADSQVDYGTSTAYGSSSPLNLTPVTAHTVVLFNLQPATVYHFRVKSRDAAGNLSLSGDFLFTTASSSTYTMTASVDTGTSPATLIVRWSVPTATPDDWIAMYPVGAANDGFIRAYIVNSQTTGTWRVRVALPSGPYEFRYLVNNTYNSVATSNTVFIP